MVILTSDSRVEFIISRRLVVEYMVFSLDSQT